MSLPPAATTRGRASLATLAGGRVALAFVSAGNEICLRISLHPHVNGSAADNNSTETVSLGGSRMTNQRFARKGGFSLIELLVTILLAVIIFAAMVPLFANALKKSSGDNLRVTATNIAQARIERVQAARLQRHHGGEPELEHVRRRPVRHSFTPPKRRASRTPSPPRVRIHKTSLQNGHRDGHRGRHGLPDDRQHDRHEPRGHHGHHDVRPRSDRYQRTFSLTVAFKNWSRGHLRRGRRRHGPHRRHAQRRPRQPRRPSRCRPPRARR